MRSHVPLVLCFGLSVLAACQREATTPEMNNAPPREASQPTEMPPAAAPAPATTASVPDAALILVTAGVPTPFVADASSRTLYYVEGDTDGSKCTGPCLETWPPVLVETTPPATSGALTGNVATIERSDGGRQITYNGHPLYRYAGDAAVGRTAGHGVQDQWGQWSAMAADGSALPKAEASKTDADATTAPANPGKPPG